MFQSYTLPHPLKLIVVIKIIIIIYICFMAYLHIPYEYIYTRFVGHITFIHTKHHFGIYEYRKHQKRARKHMHTISHTNTHTHNRHVVHFGMAHHEWIAFSDKLSSFAFFSLLFVLCTDKVPFLICAQWAEHQFYDSNIV